MGREVSVGVNAAGKAMTLDEILEFVAEARRVGLPGDSVPSVVSRMNGTIKRVTVKGVIEDEKEETSWFGSVN